ncbi:MAG: alpha/beta hydrolase [Gemmataceae bacterium]
MVRLTILLAVLVASQAAAAEPLRFSLQVSPTLLQRPYTGRVYVMLFKEEHRTLQGWPNWFDVQPAFVKDVVDWKPGTPLLIDQHATGYPIPLGRLTPGTWTVQAVIDLHPDHLRFSTAPGNLWGMKRLPLDPARSGTVDILLDKKYESPPFVETAWVKLVDLESRLLSTFHRRPTRMRAAVILPESYSRSPARRYPVVYEIPGFSGTHRMAHQIRESGVTNRAGIEVIHVVLDPSCHHGHHVFADSANNGPVGQALIEELIPAIESRFRILARPQTRLLCGHSSGGWSSLWLQVRYPDMFGGCWSTAPDPVDFRDFQRIHLYRAGENMFVDREGQRRPIARKGDKPFLWYRDFSDMEEIMGHGGQLAAFEAVFSERGSDGKPRRLWDRKTGAIDLAVARSWEKYDIRLVLERHWKDLAPKLAGKLHVYMGDLDTFYLEGATALLKESLRKLGSDAVVELFPGKNHSSLMDRPLRIRIAREMAAKLRAAGVVE